MQIGKYLQNYQPVIYKTFVNSLKSNSLSHAYLLVGNPGTPLFETAKYLAKSILCNDPDPLACDNCITCLRIDSDNYPDVMILDGSIGTIKKDAVLKVETQFDKTAFESKGIKIYIIHLVENMTVEAVNSMLKFLEEPDSVVYAFLTTNNEGNVLPTIISRCQTLYLKSRNRNDVINEANEFNINKEDAEILSYFYNDGEAIYNFLKDNSSSNYYQIKENLVSALTLLSKNDKKGARYVIDKQIIPLLKTKEDTKYFIDILSLFFEDILNKISLRDITIKSYDTMISDLAMNLPHVNESLMEILKQRNILNLNLNNGLLVDHLMSYIVKE